MTNQLAVALQNDDLVARLRDRIAEIGRMQDQLIRASKLAAVGELAAGVAHEVNNPLTGVLGYADLLLAETAPDDPSREGLEVIRDEAVRARNVVRELLDFARPRTPERRPVDLVALVHSTAELSRHLEGSDVAIVEHLEALPLVELDEGAIQQVLVNLIGNARQAVGARGTVTLSTGRDGDFAVVTITDDGIGMTPDVQRRMFEPFFTTRPMGKGRGLGLSVSLGLVESHEGTITAQSEPGRGTTVEVRLPFEASAPEAAVSTAVAAPVLAPLAAMTRGATGDVDGLPPAEPGSANPVAAAVPISDLPSGDGEKATSALIVGYRPG